MAPNSRFETRMLSCLLLNSPTEETAHLTLQRAQLLEYQASSWESTLCYQLQLGRQFQLCVRKCPQGSQASTGKPNRVNVYQHHPMRSLLFHTSLLSPPWPHAFPMPSLRVGRVGCLKCKPGSSQCSTERWQYRQCPIPEQTGC